MSPVLVSAVLICLAVQVYAQQRTCKEPPLNQRRLSDDVRAASPFYVVGLPRTPKTEQIDNICYSYYENGNDNFFNILSVTFKDGSNEFHAYVKADVSSRKGLGQAISQSPGSPCVFHDYTLDAICNTTVFPLYRCYVQGSCDGIDIGPTPDVDVKLALAANPSISEECRKEVDRTLRDTTQLDGDDYILLPYQLTPQCVTQYYNRDSIGKEKALGSIYVAENNDAANQFDNSIGNRFAAARPTVVNPVTLQTTQKTYYNPYGYSVKSNAASHSSVNVPVKPVLGNNANPIWTQPKVPTAEQFYVWHSTPKHGPPHPHVYFYNHPWQLTHALL